MKSILMAVLAFFSIASFAQADYVLTIQRNGLESVSSQSVVTFDVFLSMASGSASFDLTAVSAAFDIHKQGTPFGAPVPLGLGAVSVSNYLTVPGLATFAPPIGATNPDFDVANNIRSLSLDPNFDFNVNADKTTAGGLTLQIGTSYRLFQVSLNTGSLAAGTYELAFQNDPSYFDPSDSSTTSIGFLPFSGTGDPGTLSNLSVTSTSFSITAVPEPSSGVMALCLVLGAAFTRVRTFWKKLRGTTKDVPCIA